MRSESNMKIIVVTSSCSKNKYDVICNMRNKPVVDPQQKFFRLLIEGFATLDDINVEVVSALPVSATTVAQKKFNYESEMITPNIKYHYIPFVNGMFSRYIYLAWSAHKFSRRCMKNQTHEETYVIVDAMVPIISIPCKKVAKRYGIKIGAIVTDIPSLATNMKEHNDIKFKSLCLSLYQKIANSDLKSYDFYIPLTESINDVVNVNRQPYCIVEGLVDSEDTETSVVHENYIMYAGVICEKYGVNNLVDAFISLDRNDVELRIYGDGSYVDELKNVCHNHSNVKYMGCLSAEEIVEYEKKALLLVNPRPTDEVFAKYSFPSKTMEYLLSGTAVVSTKLPGIPDEYFQYMYSFDDYSIEGIKYKLNEILDLPKEQLVLTGKRGHKFVIKNKSNVVIAKKIEKFLRCGLK